jgi:hypothetical protein
MQRHRWAVIRLAHRSATNAVKRQLQAQGVKLAEVLAKEIMLRAEAFFEVHRAELIARAEEVIATSPHFARWRCSELINSVQTQKPQNSIASTVQMSGAK